MRHKQSLSRSGLFRSAGRILLARVAAGLAAVLALSACGPKFGDGCKNSTDCSIQNTRICDRSQPGGYCTIANCKPGDCGDDGVCVRFRPAEPRLSTSYCMAKCDTTSDCDRDAYYCRSAQQLTDEQNMGVPEDEAEPFAEVLDGSGRSKFCVARNSEPSE